LNIASATEPEHRFNCAGQMAQMFRTALENRELRKVLPQGGRFMRLADQQPILSLAIIAIAAQMLGMGIGITYVLFQIVNGLTGQQEYQLYVFLAGLLVVSCVFQGVFWLLAGRRIQVYQHLTMVDTKVLGRARKQLLQLPLWNGSATVLFLLIGGVLLPHLVEGNFRLPSNFFTHSLIGFGLAALISVSYALPFLQLVILRILFPELCGYWVSIRTAASKEIHFFYKINFLCYLMTLVPLTTVVLLDRYAQYALLGKRAVLFSLLMNTLMGFSALGAYLAVRVAGTIEKVRSVLFGETSS
jgi:hypothetical protein